MLSGSSFERSKLVEDVGGPEVMLGKVSAVLPGFSKATFRSPYTLSLLGVRGPSQERGLQKGHEVNHEVKVCASLMIPFWTQDPGPVDPRGPNGSHPTPPELGRSGSHSFLL